MLHIFQTKNFPFMILQILWCDAHNIVTELWSIQCISGYYWIFSQGFHQYWQIGEGTKRSMFWFIRKAADERMCLQPVQSTSQVCRSPSWRATSCLFQSILNQWQYYGPCDTILNAVLRSWYLSNWNKCVGRRAQVGLLSNRHCWRETRYLSSNWRSSYCTTSVTRRRQGPRLTWKSKSSGEPSYCTPNCHPTWFLRRFLDTLRWLSCLPIQLYKPDCDSFWSVISSIDKLYRYYIDKSIDKLYRYYIDKSIDKSIDKLWHVEKI